MTEANTLIANTQSLVDSVLEALDDNNDEVLQSTFSNLEASEIVHLLESIPDALRGRLWQYIPEEFNGEVLVELGDVARVSLAKYLDRGLVVEAVSDLDTNDLADVVDTLPDEFGDAIRQSLDFHGLQNLEACLAFDEDTAGRLMETDAIAIRSDVTLEAILRYLRLKETIPEHTMGLMVIDRESRFLGELPLSELIIRNPDSLVSEVMDTDALSVPPEMPQNEVAVLFREHDLTALPVVDEEKKLIGRITLDDMIEILDEEADRQILGSVGLDEEEDLFSPCITKRKKATILARYQSRYCIFSIVGNWLIRGHFRQSGCSSSTDADCCKHGRHCWNPNTHPNDSWFSHG
ncbi:Magnesium transporter MgtE [Nymphon striatum]|nr:Magnesium transporter MgtE [Nymphon striatum]